MTLRAALLAGGALAAFFAIGALASEAPKTSPRPVLRPAVLTLPKITMPDVGAPGDGAPRMSMAGDTTPDLAMPALTMPEVSQDATLADVLTDVVAVAVIAPGQPDLRMVRPRIRPMSEQLIAVAARVPTDPVYSPDASPLPTDRPDSVVQKALFGKKKKRKGSVCGDIDIQGDTIGNYGKGGGCFIQNAVRVKSVSGVRLSQSALMTCDTAKSLKTWVDKGVQPAFGRKVVEMKVAAHYSCRTRNNKAGAKLSEHAKGRAIDISAFTLSNGKQVTVLGDWGRGRDGKALRKVHQAACGPFGTVLGPGSDGYHRDHIHMDTARYRSGAYCR